MYRCSRVGEQYELALDDVRVRVPWSGVSPRALTRVNNDVKFSVTRQKNMSALVLRGQYDLFVAPSKKGGPAKGGAPPLLPLPWEV